MSLSTPTSLSSLEQFTWASSLAPAMEPDEYVFILSCLQPYADMARLCRLAQQRRQKNPSSQAIVLALSCMNQYELRRACHEWKAIIVHIDPECTALQRAVSAHYNRYHVWAAIQAIVWGGLLAAVGLRENKIVRNSRWPTSRLASACVVAIGCLFTASCAAKTTEFMMAIPQGYDVIRIKRNETDTGHLFLIRRDFKRKTDPRIVPMYLLSGLGLGTMILGARIAFKIRKAID
ncbi:hypothetical protein BGZ99_000714 [Dissophora globulifera]|uniref:Uncharacterized protein n=1 Tax=Dissophora globulifera TaxID=979702 RepID=A0A9P6R0N0_9FUNG|nr:hypothetical protein BGZ99_000714 [Dissophora globulifera]